MDLPLPVRQKPGSVSATLRGYSVRMASGAETVRFSSRHHYSGGCHNGPMGWALISPGGDMHGVCAFATPSSENVRASVFGPEHKDAVTELHRLVVLDEARSAGVPTSWFVSRAIRGLREYRPKIRAIISFADSTEGHHGGIYRALNFLRCGATGRSIFFRDEKGRLRHPRQGGANITRTEAESRGWEPEMREAKNRYVLIVGDKRQKRVMRRLFLLDVEGAAVLKGEG